MATKKTKFKGANEFILDVLKTYKVPVVATRMMAEHEKLRARFKTDKDYVSRTLSGLWREQRVGRCASKDDDYTGKYAYAVPGVEGIKLIAKKGGARKVKRKAREIEAGTALTAHVNGADHARVVPTAQTPQHSSDDDVVIESGNARITMSPNKITIEPRHR